MTLIKSLIAIAGLVVLSACEMPHADANTHGDADAMMNDGEVMMGDDTMMSDG
ncbi:MAG: hypothetical protein V3U96_11610 [Paracoccaceae bacterium]